MLILFFLRTLLSFFFICDYYLISEEEGVREEKERVRERVFERKKPIKKINEEKGASKPSLTSNYLLVYLSALFSPSSSCSILWEQEREEGVREEN